MTELNDKQIRILQVAERLFAEKGFDGTSVRDISKEANTVGSSRVDLQACKLEYSIVSPK